MRIYHIAAGWSDVVADAIKTEVEKANRGDYPRSWKGRAPTATILILEDADSYFETVQAIAHHTTPDAPPTQGLIS